jgi:hypothetical protein
LSFSFDHALIIARLEPLTSLLAVFCCDPKCLGIKGLWRSAPGRAALSLVLART